MIFHQSDSTRFFEQVYPEFKFWLSIGGFFFGVFKVINWFKDIKTKDLKSLQEGVVSIQSGLSEMKTEVTKGLTDVKAEVTTQTSAVVNELKELRADYRAYNTPPLRIRGAKAKSTKAVKRK